MDADECDERAEELGSLEAIYPELSRTNADPYAFTLDIPVELDEPATVTFASDSGAPNTLTLRHLPALTLTMALPKGYPSTQPEVSLTTQPQWLAREHLSRLEADAPRMWEEAGREAVVCFSYVDHLQTQARELFGIGSLELSADLMAPLRDHERQQKQADFDRKAFTCGVCLDSKPGKECHQLSACGHVYCRACLVSYYEHSIASSKPAQIVCMDEKCAKSRAAAMSPAVSAAVPHAIPTLSPAELFSIGLDESTIRKFVTLREKMAREADKNTVYCPRTWCDGIARPRKPASPGASPASPKPDPESNLAVCTDCSFAFCRHCAQSWHGPYEECRIRTKDQVDANERATERYILENTRACPTCGAPSQKTQGCNHMQCPRCQTHFCYLCSSWLDPRNPYGHYNSESGGGPTECNQRLWEGTDLDALGAPPGQPGRQAPAARGNAVPRAANAVVPQVRDIVAAREGPLVLRLFENAPPPPAAVEPAPPQRDLNQHERDWVMRFVELALQDREDEMPSDDDDDDLIDDRVFAIPRANAL